MNRYTALVAAAVIACAGLVGCQSSGHAEAKPDEARPQMASGTVTDASAYTVPYVATTDTPWMNTSIDTSAAGTLKSGDTVYLRSDAATTGVVPARTADGKIIYVRAADLRAK
jgi:hypothetical protein